MQFRQSARLISEYGLSQRAAELHSAENGDLSMSLKFDAVASRAILLSATRQHVPSPETK
jgi:hypothetical protein